MILYREVKRGGDEVKSLASSQSFKTSWSTLKYAQNLLMQNLHFSDMKPKTSDFCNEVLLGFSKPQKAIHPKFLFDKHGADIFEQICELEEYYITRTEFALLRTHCKEIAELIGEKCLLIEYGSGNSQKFRIFLDVLKEPSAYMPIDISKEYMLKGSEEISKAYPELDVISVCADITQKLVIPLYDKKAVKTKVIFFPGSTIGNLNYLEAVELLNQSANIVGTGGGMLLGVDLKKDPQILHAAYNDSQNITADFNLNLLARINRELDGNFDLSAFSHYAFYNPKEGRIEMHLVSLKKQVVSIKGQEFSFQIGESIHTENSYKFSIDEVEDLSKKCGFKLKKVWSDPDNFCGMFYLAVV
jgi:dimethylhistidine N-methyltransferase